MGAGLLRLVPAQSRVEGLGSSGRSLGDRIPGNHPGSQWVKFGRILEGICVEKGTKEDGDASVALHTSLKSFDVSGHLLAPSLSPAFFSGAPIREVLARSGKTPDSSSLGVTSC